MLVGFFKDHKDTCTCQIEKYVDRIWIINQDGDVEVLRKFVVSNISPTGGNFLTKIKMLIPYRHVFDLLLKNKTCFDENLIFNSPKIRSTSNYEIIKIPNKVNDYGVISDDGIENIKVFTNIKLEDTNIGKNEPKNGKPSAPDCGCTILEIIMPAGAGLLPGEKAEFRLSFKINNLLDKIGTESIVQREIILDYFVGYKWQMEIGLLGRENEIKVKPTLGGPGSPGGFDIFIYVIPTLDKIDGFDNRLKPSWHDNHNIDGKETQIEWNKYPFRLRDMIKDKSPIEIGDNISIIGRFVERYDVRKAITGLSETVNNISNKTEKETRKNKYKFIASITLASISFVGFIVLTLLRACGIVN